MNWYEKIFNKLFGWEYISYLRHTTPTKARIRYGNEGQKYIIDENGCVWPLSILPGVFYL